MFAEHITYQDKKKYMSFAIYSACFGAVIQRSLSESSVFIVYASALGAGKFLSLVTTALIPLMTMDESLFYSMASVIIFGMSLGTIMTLGAVPALYYLLLPNSEITTALNKKEAI